jgi:uncharacterized protein YfbU (UPF0304 family)
LVKEAILSDNLWGLDWAYDMILGETPDKAEQQLPSEVARILQMWTYIEESHDRLSPPNKKRVAEADRLYGATCRFPGFDGNTETAYLSAARFMIEHLGRFDRFKGRDLNSHMDCLGAYARMWRVFESLRSSLTEGLFSADQIIQLVAARNTAST